MNQPNKERFKTSVGGQALMEGIMMRGAISMIESLIMGYKYMMYSAQVSMGDDYDPAEEETAFEKWVGDHLGKKAEDIMLAAAAVIGGLFAILLFTVLPTVLVGGLNHLVPLGRWDKVVLEAVLKVAIFLTYMAGCSSTTGPSTRPLPATRPETPSRWRMSANIPASTPGAAPAF